MSGEIIFCDDMKPVLDASLKTQPEEPGGSSYDAIVWPGDEGKDVTHSSLPKVTEGIEVSPEKGGKGADIQFAGDV